MVVGAATDKFAILALTAGLTQTVPIAPRTLRFPAWAIETKQNSQQMKRDWEYGRYHAMKQNHKEPRKLILLDVAMVSC